MKDGVIYVRGVSMKVKKYRSTYYREDLENPETPFLRVTLSDLVDQLNGDGSGPVKWTERNVDILRVASEWEEIGFRLWIKKGERWSTLPLPIVDHYGRVRDC